MQSGSAHGAIPSAETRWSGVDAFVLPAVVLVLVLHGLPPLSNAAGTQSDAAVVGLQALHFLRGEWGWFLWGSGYQTSVDSAVSALWFWLFGPTPLSLMLSVFAGHVALVIFAFATIRRHFGPWVTALLVSPLVLTPGPLHTYMFYPPRQASLTVMFAALWLLDGAPASRRPALRLSLGAFTTGVACFADPYCLLFLPAAFLLIVLAARADGRRTAVRPALAALGSGMLGLLPFVLLSRSAQASHHVYHLTPAVVRHNLKLLTDDCLPFLLSTRVRFFPNNVDLVTWEPPSWFRVVQTTGATLFVMGILVGGAAFLVRKIPFGIRRIGLFGAAMLPVTVLSFLLSTMVMDRLSARYLASLVLASPFALAPVAHLLGARKLGCFLAPYLLSTAVAGWLQHGSDVDGLRIRHENGQALDEARLSAELRARGIHYGIADYWVAYRLTFLFHEDPLLVPWHVEQDRYPPYRALVQAAPVVAYVYDPWRSVEDLQTREAQFRSGETDFDPVFEEQKVGRYTLLVLRRRSSSGSQLLHASSAEGSGGSKPSVSHAL